MTEDNKPGRKNDEAGPGSSAFDTWLDRGLHQLFDKVANEPIPIELLRLIEDDKTKVGGLDH